MVCDQIIREKERKLGRKLTEKEKREIMMMHGHSEEEIFDEMNGELIYA